LTLGEVLDIAGNSKELLDTAMGYGPSAGLRELREVIANTNGVPIDWVMTTHGSALSLFLLAMELCRPGDQAIIARPSFPPARDTLKGSGAEVIEVPCNFAEDYRLRPERIAAALSPKTKLVSIASPQNPSGVRAAPEDVAELLSVMTERAPQAWLLVDEVYREAAYGNDPVPPTAANLGPRVITAASISKAHGAPGLRVGWMTVPDDDLRRRLVSAKINTIVSCSMIGELLAAKLLKNVDSVLAPRRKVLREALDILSRWHTGERHRLDWVRPHAGALCCMRLRADVFGDAAVERFWATLPANSLQLAPGTWFGEEPRVFRLGFGYLPLERLPEALAALSKTLNLLA
jgi:hypothetical protein